MNATEKVLDSLGINYEDLNHLERETLIQQEKTLGAKSYDMHDLKEDLVLLKESIAMQLIETPDDDDHRLINIKLKARLKNYIVLYAKIVAPDKAKKALEQTIALTKSSTEGIKY